MEYLSAQRLKGLTWLITGGTGTLGHALVEAILPLHPERLIILSRDEWKQNEMRKRWPDEGSTPIRYFIGDVRDGERLRRAFRGVDVIIHAAALKQVPACEYNPREALRTNVDGAQNVIDAALDCDVKRVLLASTDKAVAPCNTYGCSKALAARLFIQANSYSGESRTRFAVVRYGNVVGSRGSVVPLFLEQAKSGVVTITDARMTRFWITQQGAVELVLRALERMRGGETFVPKIPSMRVVDLATALAPQARQQVIGIRPGEKLHEALISDEESAHTLDMGDLFVIQPLHPWWTVGAHSGTAMPDGWSYRSDNNPDWLRVEDIRRLLNPPEVVPA